jgi:3',5'-cyclic AMP phosphodiesterase CpdA
LADAISIALDRDNIQIGAVIATGDFSFVGTADEFAEAHTGLSKLTGRLDIAQDQFVLVPGNHDIQWSKKETYEDGADVELAPEEASKNYREFYSTFYRHDSNATMSMGRRLVLPIGLVLDVCGLNSSSLATGKNFLAGMGRIDEYAFETVATSLGWKDKSTLTFRLLAIHHHLVHTEDLESPDGYGKGFGIAVDAARIQRKAANFGVHLALHGHRHRAFLWRSGVYRLPERAEQSWSLGDVSVVGGGSAGSTDVESNFNYFSVLEFSTMGLAVHMYRSQNGGSFDLFHTAFARFGLLADSGQLTLGDWETQG